MNILIMDNDCEDREKLVKMIKSLKKDAAIFWAENDNRGYEIASEYNLEIAVIDMSYPKIGGV